MAQEMQHGEQINHDRPQSSYGNYEGGSSYNHSMPDPTITYGQKITGARALSTPSAGLRVLLAIFSLVLFIGMFLLTVAVISGFPGNSNISSLSMLGLILFFVLIIIVNALFNRKR